MADNTLYLLHLRDQLAGAEQAANEALAAARGRVPGTTAFTLLACEARRHMDRHHNLADQIHDLTGADPRHDPSAR